MYEIEYNGYSFDETTEIQALAAAKHVIRQDIGSVERWAVEHDEVINVWFVQGLAGGSPVGATATVTGPQQTAVAVRPSFPAHVPAADHTAPLGAPHRIGDTTEQWIRCIAFAADSPSEVFSRSLEWMVAHQHEVQIGGVGWAGGFRLTVYYHFIQPGRTG